MRRFSRAGSAIADSRRRLAESIEAELRRNAANVLPDLPGRPVSIELTSARTGEWFSFFTFDVAGGGEVRSVFVKAPIGRKHSDPTFDPRAMLATQAPRIGRWSEPATILRNEFATLTAIQEHLREVADPRLRAVRVFDVFADRSALAMERLDHPTLRSLLIRERWPPGAADPERLGAAFRHAGAWLRAFHTLPRLPHAESRRTRRSEFLDSFDEFGGYLVDHGVGEPLVSGIVTRARTAAERLLPEDLPAAMGHGDYAPRNVLVGPAEQVFVIDTPGEFWFPIHQDIGYFLTALKTMAPQALTGGLAFAPAKIAALESEFLRGYFGGAPPPIPAIRLFEAQTLLSRWVSAVELRQRARGADRWRRQLALLAKTRWCRRCLDRVLADASTAAERSERN